jgi:aspartyl/glutamyl-tRNA(Asn/Gln) amidotransferase C subunit
MSIITKEEVLKLAKLSHIQIHENEAAPIMQKLETVLAYAARVQEVAGNQEYACKNVNIMRDDVVEKFNADAIMACAPESEAHLFVVPAILEK